MNGLHRVPRERLGVLMTVVAWLMAAAIGAAQGGTGLISGTIRDAQGAVLPGVTLTLRNQATGVARTTTSETDGTLPLSGVESRTVYALRRARGLCHHRGARYRDHDRSRASCRT